MSLAAAIRSFEDRLGASVCFHDHRGWIGAELLRRASGHERSPCSEQKRQDLGGCIAFDAGLCGRHVKLARQGFWKECHAGVLECCLPLSVGPDLVGVLFVGLYRWAGKEPLPDAVLTNPDASRRVKSSRELTPLSRTAELDELLELARMLRARIVECLRPPDASSAPRRERIAAYVLTHCQGPLRLDDLARHLALSSSRTSQLVRELFNETMPELVTRFRLEQAKSMLDHSDYSIAEVADKSGFSEVGYLHRVFQRHFGLTPGEYRKRERRDRARSV